MQGENLEPRIARIDQIKLRESAYDALRDAFTRGVFAPGETVSLRMFADQLGISLTPVREAVRRLVAQGALIDTPSRTLVVPPLEPGRMQEVQAARLTLEAQVLDMAMERMTPATLEALEAILATPRRYADHPDPVRNREFHFTLYRQSGSEVLLPLVEALWLQHGAYLNPVFASRRAGEVDEDLYHDELMAALQKRDRDRAQAALKADISRSFDILRDIMGEAA